MIGQGQTHVWQRHLKHEFPLHVLHLLIIFLHQWAVLIKQRNKNNQTNSKSQHVSAYCYRLSFKMEQNHSFFIQPSIGLVFLFIYFRLMSFPFSLNELFFLLHWAVSLQFSRAIHSLIQISILKVLVRGWFIQNLSDHKQHFIKK